MSPQASPTHTDSKKETTSLRRAPVSQDMQASTQTTADLLQAIADPQAAGPEAVLTLQRRYGNRAVQRLLSRGVVQAKLSVGPASDSYEQEADRVAEKVMAMSASQPAPGHAAIQRAGPQEEEEVQTKPLAGSITPLVQRAGPEEEEEVQTKALVQRAGPEEEEEVQAKLLVQRAGPEEEEEVQTKRQDSADTVRPGAGFEADAA